MPELPDIETYLSALRPRVQGQPLAGVRVVSPSLLRSVQPPLREAHGKTVVGLRRLGKRIVFALEDELFLVLHLMISGRLKWKPPGCPIPRKVGMGAFDFEQGSLLLTEASSHKRASLYTEAGEDALAEHDPGGIEVLEADLATFEESLLAENRTLKRALTDPRLFSGIGNAYSDEILHHAGLSPIQWTSRLTADQIAQLHESIQVVLRQWTQRLIEETGDGFPEKVTAFRPEMAVHGKYGQPCPVCENPVQRIRYAKNEVNYCATCQTGGKLLADRSLSRLLRKDWPRSLEELEERTGTSTPSPPPGKPRRRR